MSLYYSKDGIEIWHGDCREILPTLPKVDLVLTDPPYGIGASGGIGKYGVRKFADADYGWDDSPPTPELIQMVVAMAPKAVLWGGNYYQGLPPSRQWWVWDKGAGFKGRNFAECELAWCSWDGNAKTFLRDPLAHKDYDYKHHPTMKPLNLFLWCIANVPDALTILDPFMGSGTTLVAAKVLDRKAIGIELEEKYCEIAAKRLENTTPSLFREAM